MRELENVLQRAIVLSDEKIIDESHIMVDVSCNTNLYKNFVGELYPVTIGIFASYFGYIFGIRRYKEWKSSL